MVAVADGLEKHRLHFEFWEQDRKLIEEARFFFIATSYEENVDCSMRSGDPGVRQNNRTEHLEYPEYDGKYAPHAWKHSPEHECRAAVPTSRRQNVPYANPRQSNDPRYRGSACQAPWRKDRVRVKCEIFPIVLATFQTSSALPGLYWPIRSFPDRDTSRHHRNGKVETTSKTCSPKDRH
jgi:hypothetical protein